MKQTYLTKSDFKTAEDCPTKLYYKKSGYPNIKDKEIDSLVYELYELTPEEIKIVEESSK